MTRKRPLYAYIAAVAFFATPPFAAAKPPCVACVLAGAAAADWNPSRAESLALIVPLTATIDTTDPLLARARTIVLDLPPAGALERTSFAARRALAAIRGANATARLGIIAPTELASRLLDAGLSAYVDVVVAPGIDAKTAAAWQRAHGGLEVWTTLSFVSFDALLEQSRALPAGVSGALIWPVIASRDLIEGLSALAPWFPDRLVELPDADARCEPASSCRTELFERADTHERIALIRPAAHARATVILRAPQAQLLAIASAASGSSPLPDLVMPVAPALSDASGVIRVTLAQTGVTLLIASIPAPAETLSENVSVIGARQLSVDEIVARHQAQAARQSAVVRTLLTEARTVVTLDIPSFAAPVTIEADTTMIDQQGTLEVAQRNIRVNGAAFSRQRFPRLPVIEPERVAAPPLAITLTRAYRYRLDGRDRVNGRAAYVVSFDPADERATLFKGRAWIDATTFALLRVDAVQTNLRGPITSSQLIEEFEAVPAGTDTVWLLARSETRQVYQGAGLTTPIHRVVVVERREINPSDLDARRQAAQVGALVLRDTGEGLRDASGRRATRIVTLAGGVLIDPNISQPLPFAGVNYSDFNFAGIGAQVNAFFGGAYGQFAFSVPSLAGSRWQLAGAGFAMLARYNDRSFRAGRERYDENLSQRPAHVSVGVVRPITARTSTRIEYVVDYVALDRTDSTAAGFVVPADQVVHGARLSLETQQAGWRLAGWWNPARRAGWHPWGVPGSADYRPQDRDFQRAGFSASRPWLLAPRMMARVEAAWMAGTDLDRFSRYGFDSFENRLRGYPSASVRYDRGGVLRTALVAQPGGRLRLDAFGDVALVREPGFGRALRTYPGIGAALEAPGPFGLLLGAEWGFGFRGLNTNGTQGTQVIRLTAYKLF